MTTSSQTITTLLFYPKRSPLLRYFALWYFCILIVLWNIFGHTVLGFEQAWIHPVVAVATCIVVQFLLEWLDARGTGRQPRFAGSIADFLNFLPPAIIPGLASAMMLYPNERLFPIVFAAALSICSKVLFRAPVGGGKTQHIFNPSNLGITATLLFFPWVGLAPPYHFTENLTGLWHWVLPGVILLTGIIVHALFTGRLPLVLAWIVAFVVQGQLRSWYFDTSWIAPLTPMTSAAFILFTLYMIPDPATTPINRWRQVGFGVLIAALYGLLQVLHIVFGLFIALALSSALRGLGLYLGEAFRAVRAHQPEPVLPEPVLAGAPQPALAGVPDGRSGA
jgi:Na+-translocating ferredoxin:NAD+ oxidoreductase RnfD subunit